MQSVAVYNNDDGALKLTEDAESNWRSLQFLGVQFEDYVTVLSRSVDSECLSAVGQGVDQARRIKRKESG